MYVKFIIKLHKTVYTSEYIGGYAGCVSCEGSGFYKGTRVTIINGEGFCKSLYWMNCFSTELILPDPFRNKITVELTGRGNSD